ncbi:MAG TPA: alpha/beta hydrolase [Devosia sp.]|nr:alpha/beta hydrolase [Devosia sp.]
METFDSDGVRIAYHRHGAGRPIILVHGFASNGRVNWLDTGWVDTLCEAGWGPISIDNRGHGESEKLYDPALYPARTMAGDVARLIVHLGLVADGEGVPVMGYSMGARICAFLCMDHPELVRAAIFGGLGINMIRGIGGSEAIVQALLAPDLDHVRDRTGRQFRIFAEHTRSDLKALAACMQSSRDPIRAEDLSGIRVPVLVAVGERDEVGGSAEELAALLPRGTALVIPGRDHMRATGDALFKKGVIEFLSELPT